MNVINVRPLYKYYNYLNLRESNNLGIKVKKTSSGSAQSVTIYNSLDFVRKKW